MREISPLQWGFKSHPPHQSPSSVPSTISLIGVVPTKRTEKSKNDPIFEQALRRLKNAPDVSDEDTTCIMKLVEHLLAKGVSKQRVVKYVNHLIVFARIAAKLLGQLENEKRAFEEVSKEFESAKRGLDKLPSQEEIETEKEPITIALAEASEQLQALINKLGYEPKEPQEELEQLRKKKEKYDQNAPIARRKAEYESSAALARAYPSRSNSLTLGFLRYYVYQ